MKQIVQSSSQISLHLPEKGVSLVHARESLLAAAGILFNDPRVRSIGVAQYKNDFGYRVVRNAKVVVPQGSTIEAGAFLDVPIAFIDVERDVTPLVSVPHSGPGSPEEKQPIRPLCLGAQIQNFDFDLRSGAIDRGWMNVGTLGCFVKLADGSVALLSNNHVLAGQNEGSKAADRILQPGGSCHNVEHQIGILRDFVPLIPSPAGAHPSKGTAIFNVLDAAIANLGSGIEYKQSFLNQTLPALRPPVSPEIGERVFKVGRTTGLTFGEIKTSPTIVGLAYAPGYCWFSQSMEIEGENGTRFSDSGDSGAAVARASGELLGLVFAGNGIQTYACPALEAFAKFNCTLA